MSGIGGCGRLCTAGGTGLDRLVAHVFFGELGVGGGSGIILSNVD